MKRTHLFGIAIVAFALVAGCSAGTQAGNAGDQATAVSAANEMVYGTENDEVTSASSPLNGKGITATDTNTVTFEGSESGTATCVHDVTWTETGTSLGTQFNRTFPFSGTRSVAFSDYSNLAGRSIDGTVTATIASGNFTSSTGGVAVASGTIVTDTASNVQKTIVGTVTLTRNGKTFTCALDLTVVVVSRATNWTLDGGENLTDPVVQSRNVNVSGTLTLNGTSYAVDYNLSSARPQ
jgi:hypothetical protein